MTKPKYTPWFDGSVKPARPGPYERIDENNFFGVMRWSFWTGKHWGLSRETVREADIAKSIKSHYQSIRWRGLASDPRAAK